MKTEKLANTTEAKLQNVGQYVKALIKTIIIFIIFYWILSGFSIDYNKESN